MVGVNQQELDDPYADNSNLVIYQPNGIDLLEDCC